MYNIFASGQSTARSSVYECRLLWHGMFLEGNEPLGKVDAQTLICRHSAAGEGQRFRSVVDIEWLSRTDEC